MLLGVHVSAAGKIFDVFSRAKKLKCNTLQFFSRNPQQWRSNLLSASDIAEFRKQKDQSGIKPVFIHAAYLANLASPVKGLYDSSIKAYIEDIQEAEKLGVDYLVTHMGSHKETSEESGLERLTQALNVILEKTRGLDVGILLENTAGSGSWLGYDFAHQKKVLEGLKGKIRIGLCLDTAHAYAAGYDIATEEGLEVALDEIDMLVSLKLIKLVHLNDTSDTLFSHRDHHAHIGKGKIGFSGMKRIINHPKLRDLPFILETPKDSPRADALNLKRVRELKAS